MLNNVITTVVDALNAADIPACSAWRRAAAERNRSIICVGVERAEDCGAFARYLGMEMDEVYGEREVYGLHCMVGLSLDIYAPLTETNAANACLDLFDAAAGVISCMQGLQVQTLSCGAPAPDKENGMFRLRCGVKCSALLLSTTQGEDGSFTDFVLRGELQK